jgi:hypothetical protein
MTAWPGLSLTAMLEHYGGLVASEMIDGQQAWQRQRWGAHPPSIAASVPTVVAVVRLG